jgi:hypothetical protein
MPTVTTTPVEARGVECDDGVVHDGEGVNAFAPVGGCDQANRPCGVAGC